MWRFLFVLFYYFLLPPGWICQQSNSCSCSKEPTQGTLSAWQISPPSDCSLCIFYQVSFSKWFQSPASHHYHTIQSICPSSPQTVRQSTPRSTSYRKQEQQSGSLPRSQSLKTCLTRCMSRQHCCGSSRGDHVHTSTTQGELTAGL